MSVTVSSVVDAIGIEVETDRVVLALSDHLSWGTRERLEALQTKINSYLALVEHDEVLEEVLQPVVAPYSFRLSASQTQSLRDANSLRCDVGGSGRRHWVLLGRSYSEAV